MKFLLATNNKGKIAELGSIITSDDCQMVTPSELNLDLDVEETGETFEQNAVLKAKAFAEASGLPAIADDSGLEVEALNWGPGVYSARYGGEGASDEDRVKLLLKNLAPVPWERREARFRCVIAVAFPDGRVELCQGACPGVIALEPKGANGFGYDPVFYLPEFGKTMAEISAEAKNSISHRGKAARNARQIIALMMRKSEA